MATVAATYQRGPMAQRARLEQSAWFVGRDSSGAAVLCIPQPDELFEHWAQRKRDMERAITARRTS